MPFHLHHKTHVVLKCDCSVGLHSFGTTVGQITGVGVEVQNTIATTCPLDLVVTPHPI